MANLAALWHILEKEPVLSAVEAQWRLWLGDAFHAMRPFLRPEKELASRYPCERNPELCTRRIVYYDQDDIVAVCGREEAECDPLLLIRQDVVVYELAHSKLLTHFAALLKLEGSVTPVMNQTIWSMGIWRQRQWSSTMFFMLPNRYDGYISPLAQLFSRFTEGNISMLVPNTASIAANEGCLIRQRKAELLSCNHYFEVDRGKIIKKTLPKYQPTKPSKDLIHDSHAKYRKTPFAFSITDLESNLIEITDSEQLQRQRNKEKQFDHFVDATTDRPFCSRRNGTNRSTSELTQGETAMLLTFIIRAIAGCEHERPENLPIPNLSTKESKKQVFKEMRRKVDSNTTSRQKYALFKSRRDFHGGSQLYALCPDANSSFCFLVRAEDFNSIRSNLLK